MREAGGDRNVPTVTVSADLLQRYPDSVAVRVVGISMQPTLLDGDCVLLDVSATEPEPGAVVVVYIRDAGRVVGRLQRTARATWLMKDNRVFKRMRLLAGGYTILGTVRSVVSRAVGGVDARSSGRSAETAVLAPVATAVLAPLEIRSRHTFASARFRHAQLSIASPLAQAIEQVSRGVLTAVTIDDGRHQ